VTQQKRRSFFDPEPAGVPVAPPLFAPVQPYPYQEAPVPAVPANLEIRVTILGHTNAAVAKADLTVVGQPYGPPVATARGSSSRHPDDEPDEEIGALKAVSRALHSLARQMDRHAARLTRQADTDRERKAAARRMREGMREFSTNLLRDELADSFGIVAEARVGREGDIRDGVTVYLREGGTEADVPADIKEMIGNLFPGAGVTYKVEDVIARAITRLEGTVRRDSNGRSAKREGPDPVEAPEEEPGE